MLTLAAMVVGGPFALKAKYDQLANLDFFGWMALAGCCAATVAFVVGVLQRIVHRRLILTPTDLLVPSSALSSMMTAIPRSSITKCQIVVRPRRYRTLVVFHRRGQFQVSDDQLPRSAINEIFDSLAAELRRKSIGMSPEHPGSSGTGDAGSILDLKYGERVNWLVPVALSTIAALIALLAFEPTRHLFDEAPWSLAGGWALCVVVGCLVIINLRRPGSIVVTESTLSAPVAPGSNAQLTIPLSSIRHLDIANDEQRKRRLVVSYSTGSVDILERALESRTTFDQLYTTLSTATVRSIQ
jgi:hypothetical protein